MDSITPDDIDRATFDIAFRGYEREEVDTYLAAVAESMRTLLKDASDNAYRALGQHMGELLQHAKDSSEEMVRSAGDEAARIRSEALAEAEEVRAAAERDAAEARAATEAEGQRRIGEADGRVRALEAEEAAVRERLGELRERLAQLGDRLGELADRPETTGAAIDLDGPAHPAEIRLEDPIADATGSDVLPVDGRPAG